MSLLKPWQRQWGCRVLGVRPGLSAPFSWHQDRKHQANTKQSQVSLEEYITDISRVPMLTCDEEIILGSQVQEMMQILRDNGIEDQISQECLSESVSNLSPQLRKAVKKGLRARNRMVSANMRLVVAVAKKVKTTQVHMTIQDMIQEGAIGLTRAAEKFEPGRGYKFSTYAYWWIRQGIVRAGEYQERAIRIPVNVQKIAKRGKEARASLHTKLGREPTFDEIAREIDEDPEKIKRAMLFDPVVISLDFRVERDSDSIALIETLSSEFVPVDEASEEPSERLDFILMLISALPEDEQILIKQKYGIGMEALSVKEMSEASGLSQQIIRQKQQKITNKIRYVAGTFARSGFR